MELRIVHETVYDYAAPVMLAQHMAHLRPSADLPGQQLLSHQLSVLPEPSQAMESEDAFGNPRHFFALQVPHDRLCVHTEMAVRTEAPLPLPASPPWEAVRAHFAYHAGADFDAANEFVFASPFVPLGDEAAGYADYALKCFTPGRPALEALLALSAQIHADFRFDPEATSVATPASPVQAPPSFLREADRAARWRQPAVQLGLWAAVLLLALGMGLQMALLWRDTLAAHVPGTAPALQALCRLAGCSVQPLRRIHQLAVASSGLNRLDGSPLYRLQLVLRNRADTAVMMPALDLALTDPQGQLVARRVVPMTELGAPQPALQAGQELPIQVLVSTGERRVVDTENRLLNTNHAVVGYFTAKSWNLPLHLCEAIANHHNVQTVFSEDSSRNSQLKTLLAILKMAENICACYRTLGQQDEDFEWASIETTILEYVGFSEYDFQILKESIRDLDIS